MQAVSVLPDCPASFSVLLVIKLTFCPKGFSLRTGEMYWETWEQVGSSWLFFTTKELLSLFLYRASSANEVLCCFSTCEDTLIWLGQLSTRHRPSCFDKEQYGLLSQLWDTCTALVGSRLLGSGSLHLSWFVLLWVFLSFTSFEIFLALLLFFSFVSPSVWERRIYTQTEAT